MAWWGIAYASGPHVNRPMDQADNDRAWDALQKAIALKPKASAKERAYIDAMAARYQAGFVEDRSALDKAYANAMRELTKQFPDDLDAATLADLTFAWRACRAVKSNAIVFAQGGATLGVGAGQMSRLDSARIASIKAKEAGLSLAGSAVASDAFFPFRDGLDVVADAGAACVIQPGGSLRDAEVIAAADERGVAMVFTGTRHFRH